MRSFSQCLLKSMVILWLQMHVQNRWIVSERWKTERAVEVQMLTFKLKMRTWNESEVRWLFCHVVMKSRLWICLYSSADVHQSFSIIYSCIKVISTDKFDVYFLTLLEWKPNSSFFPCSAKMCSLMMLWWVLKFLLEVDCQPWSLSVCLQFSLTDDYFSRPS